jgi:hypothetical protein
MNLKNREMENQNIIFEREKVTVMQKIASNILTDTSLEIATVLDDFVKNQMTMKLAANVYYNLSEERDLEYICKRPTFLDWLLRREKKVIFNLKVKDLLLNPPKLDNTMRAYFVEQKNN